MKLRFEFEIMDMGDEIVAVPVGEGAAEFHGMLRMNQDAAEMLQQIKESNDPNEALDRICRLHPEEKRDDIAMQLADFLNRLFSEGILEP